MTLRSRGWQRSGVTVAVDPWTRFIGLRPLAAGRALLLRGAAVHGIGMREPLRLVGIDAGGVVAAHRRLEPGRVARIGGASWILELPAAEPLPAVGDTLAVRVRF